MPVEQALKDAKLASSELDEVVMVGGSTRIPAVLELVKRVTGKSPNQTVNPDEVVAVGAAIQGGVLAGEVKDLQLDKCFETIFVLTLTYFPKYCWKWLHL